MFHHGKANYHPRVCLYFDHKGSTAIHQGYLGNLSGFDVYGVFIATEKMPDC